VGQVGRWLVDGQGRVLLVHGVNVVAKDAPYYPSAFGFDDADATWLAEEGLDVVRLGVLASGEMPAEGKVDEEYLDELLATIDDLGRHHIFTLLDWHQDDYGTYFDQPGTPYRADGFPAWMTVTNGAPDKQAVFPADYVSDPALQEAFQAFWKDESIPGGSELQSYDLTMLKAVAARVKDDPWVLGYEIMNEPWPGTAWASCTGEAGCPGLEASELEPFYMRAARAIRSVDPTHVIFFEPFVLYNLGIDTTHLTLPPGEGPSALAFHEYASTPAGEKQVLANSVNWAMHHDGALLDSEWSASNGSPASVTQQADDEDSVLMPWIYWVFSGCDIACSPPGEANIVLDEEKPPSAPGNVNVPIAAAVIRPHPVALAGTPLSISYDASAHVLRCEWSAERVDRRGRFQTGSSSTFAIPPLDFPSGYSVHVSGGQVRSSSDAATLVISQTGDAKVLTVTVSPRGP